jgi:hypothetical protein
MYEKSTSKVQAPLSWTKYLMVTHPVVFISTIGQVEDKVIPGAACFATCIDSSYSPPLYNL